MRKNLDEFSYEELIEYLNLKDEDKRNLNENGILIDISIAGRLLEKLSALSFSDVRGHISVDGFANVSFSGKDKSFSYDYFDKNINTNDITVNIAQSEQLKFFLSNSMWIDFFFDLGNVRLTMVLVP